MYPREMPNSFFSRLLERVYVRGVHNSDYPLEKIYRLYKLGMTLLTVGLFPGSNVENLIRWVEIDRISPVVRLRKRTENGMVV